MTQGTVETKGTRLFFLTSSGSPQEVMKVSCPTGINGLGGATDQIDITCLDSEEREFKGGFSNPSVLTVPFNFIPRSGGQQALMDLRDNKEVVPWMIVFSDQSGEPTEGAGTLTSPGATTAAFDGYVADVTFDIATNEIVRGTMQIQRSGPITWDWPSADLP